MGWKYQLLGLMFYLIAPLILVGQNPKIDINSFNEISLETGTSDHILKLRNGTNWPIRLQVPDKLENAPLIIALHWAGDNQTYKVFMECLAKPGFAELNALIVAPSAEGQLWWEESMFYQVLELIDLINDNWAFDHSKVVVTGYSNGGTGAWAFAGLHPEYFSAAIAIAGSYAEIPSLKIPTYVIHSTNDELFDYSYSKKYVSKFQPYSSFHSTSLSHYDACNYTPLLKKAGRWLIDEVW